MAFKTSDVLEAVVRRATLEVLKLLSCRTSADFMWVLLLIAGPLLGAHCSTAPLLGDVGGATRGRTLERNSLWLVG